MKRKIIALTVSLILISCGVNGSQNVKKIKLAGGDNLDITLEVETTSAAEKVLIAEFRRDKKILKVETVDNEIQEIWKQVEAEADKKEITEGIIRAGYLIGTDEETNEPVYETLLYTTEKIENGTWQIKKVN